MNVVCSNKETWSSTAHLGPDKYVKDIESLEKYADERWDTLLHYLVGSKTNVAVSQELKDVILKAGLMRCELFINLLKQSLQLCVS